MKLIDEKGRLFGKINLVDLLVIILIVAVAVVAVIKLGGSSGGSDRSTGDKVTLRYTVTCPEIPDGVCDSVEAFVAAYADGADSRIQNNNTMCDATVISCEREDYLLTDVDDSGETVQYVDPSCDQLTFVIEAEVAFDSCAYLVGSQEIRVGRDYILKTVNYELEGIITAMEIVEE